MIKSLMFLGACIYVVQSLAAGDPQVRKYEACESRVRAKTSTFSEKDNRTCLIQSGVKEPNPYLTIMLRNEHLRCIETVVAETDDGSTAVETIVGIVLSMCAKEYEALIESQHLLPSTKKLILSDQGKYVTSTYTWYVLSNRKSKN
jgi:hypothetical protein